MIASYVVSLSILISLALSQNIQNGTGIFLVNNKDAICLDGSPGLFYISEGTESNKYVIFFQGGGICSGLSEPPSGSCFDACYDRSQTGMGSTKDDAAWINMNVIGGPVLNNDKNKNPLMADWNHIFVRYCDGGFYAGNKPQPDVYNGQNIYYKGANILFEVFGNLIRNYNFKQATDVVISGCSAGAQAVYININEMYKWMGLDGSIVNIYTIADSGFIDDYNGIDNNTQMSAGQKMAYYQHDMAGSVPAQCVTDMNANNIDPYNCLFPQYNVKYIEKDVNFFALQSQFDKFQISCVLGSTNSNDIQTFGMSLEHFVNHSLLLNKPNHGAFIDSCEHHCGGWNTIALNGVTQCDAFTQFYNNKQKQRIWYQNQTYPCASCCG
eukprot:248732_1